MSKIHCFLIAAISVDGYIAEDPSVASTTWTSGADKQFFRDRTKQAGVMIMGRATFETIGRALPGRLNVVYSRSQPEQVVGAVNLQEQKGQVVYTQAEPAKVLQALAENGFSEAALCGGAKIYHQFVEAGVVDTLYLTLEPVVFGKGVRLLGGEKSVQKLELVRQEKLGENAVLLQYSILQ